jgi:outer membrane receptor for ferrienterochelin and colicin
MQMVIAVGSQNTVQATLEKGATTELVEVVVTSGYGVKTSQKKASANVQVISAERLNIVRSTNINDALSGKASGIQFRGQSAGKLGQNGNLRLRGEGALGGGASPIYVIDGTRVSSDDVNMDDVEAGPKCCSTFWTRWRQRCNSYNNKTWQKKRTERNWC